MVQCNCECIEQIGQYLRLPSVKLSSDSTGKVPVATGIRNGPETLKGFGTIVIALAKRSKDPLFGTNKEHEALVRQWIEYAVCYGNHTDVTQTARQVLKELNSILATRCFFVGNTRTLADIVMYFVMYKAIAGLAHQEKEQYLHLSRWFNNIQQDPELRKIHPLIVFSRTLLYS